MILRWSKVIRCTIILGIIIMGEHLLLLGQMGKIKVVGKLLIPTASGDKPYNCVMVIKQEGIEIKCTMKIFQPLNQFDTPRQSKIRVNMADVDEVQIYENKIYISTLEPFWMQYRNILQHLYKNKYVGFHEYIYIEKWVLLFTVDNPADIGDKENEFIKSINKKTKKLNRQGACEFALMTDQES
jgi:hypothetical protein